MARLLDPALAVVLDSGLIQPFFMAQLTFATSTQYVWTGIGTLVWDSLPFVGVGSLANIGAVQGGIDVHAYGTSVSLSGIDNTLLGDCLNEMVGGAQAQLWFGCVTAGAIIGSPFRLFNGTMDKVNITTGVDTSTITINLESKMLDLSRASNRRYTSADQRRYYPTDIAFGWVPSLNDQADVWGT